VREGRRKEFAHFAAFADEASRASIPPLDLEPRPRHKPLHTIIIPGQQLTCLFKRNIPVPPKRLTDGPVPALAA